jgi:3-methyladenine DNA glycosylase AlkC
VGWHQPQLAEPWLCAEGAVALNHLLVQSLPQNIHVAMLSSLSTGSELPQVGLLVLDEIHLLGNDRCAHKLMLHDAEMAQALYTRPLTAKCTLHDPDG